jgi:hypothetical protein
MLATVVWIVSAATSTSAQVPLPPIKITGQVPSTERSSCCGGTGTWSLAARRAVLDSLAAGRRRWEANRPAVYRIAAGIGCGFCGYAPADGYPVARIRGGDIFATGTFRPAGKVFEGDPLAVPVDSLFRLLERAANDTARKITELTLDPLLGFPRSWATDGVHDGEGGMVITDQDDWGRVELFAPDGPPTPCGWLRRLLGACAPPFPPLDNEVRARPSAR